MKKLLFIFSILFLISCSPDKVEIDINAREKATTLELVNLAKADTNIYHVVVKDNDIYVLNKDYVVEKKLVNKAEEVGFFAILALILFIFCLLIFAV